MNRNKPFLSESDLPLSGKEFRRYEYIWSAISLGSYALAIGLTLWNAWGALSWREALLILMIFIQVGLYAKPMLLDRKGYLTKGDLAVYFIGSIGIWVIELWLAPEFFWLGFMYMGQMFGMLPALPAILGTAFISLWMFFIIYWPKLGDISTGELFSFFAGTAMVLVFLAYINQLIRTSRERGRLIAELQAAQEELEAAREHEAELAVYRERERLARDLHDSLGHTLVALSVQLEAVQRLYHVDPERASAQVDELKALTRSSMEELRRTIAGLRSPGLGDRSLRGALQTICVDFGERTGIEITWRLEDCVDRLRPAHAETIWRVVQEALTNVEKHADAQYVQLTLICEQESVTLQVEDDGVGVPGDAEMAPDQFGLRGMRERVEGLGGSLNVLNTGSGTRIDVSLPVVFEPEQIPLVN